MYILKWIFTGPIIWHLAQKDERVKSDESKETKV